MDTDANLPTNISKTDLSAFADNVIQKVSNYITDPTYSIIWRDIHFEYDFEVLVMDVIDSEGVSYNADINVDIKEFVNNADYHEQCITDFVDQITDVYAYDEIG